MTPAERLLFKAAFDADDPSLLIRLMTPTQQAEYSRLLDRKFDTLVPTYRVRTEAAAERLEDAVTLLRSASFEALPAGVTAEGCVLILKAEALVRRLAA